MRIFPLFDSPADVGVKTLLDLAGEQGAGFRAGSVRLAPGQRVPAEGSSVHTADEVSFIVTGSLSGESGGEPFTTKAGDVNVITAGERHWAVAGPEGAEVFWVWFGDLG